MSVHVMPTTLSHLTTDVLVQITTANRPNCSVLWLWSCGDTLLNLKLKQANGLEIHLCETRLSKTSIRHEMGLLPLWPSTIQMFNGLRVFSIKCLENISNLTISRLPPTLELLSLRLSNVATITANINFATLFPKLHTLCLESTNCTDVGDVLPKLPPSLTDLTVGRLCGYYIECDFLWQTRSKFFADLPPYLRRLCSADVGLFTGLEASELKRLPVTLEVFSQRDEYPVKLLFDSAITLIEPWLPPTLTSLSLLWEYEAQLTTRDRIWFPPTLTHLTMLATAQLSFVDLECFKNAVWHSIPLSVTDLNLSFGPTDLLDMFRLLPPRLHRLRVYLEQTTYNDVTHPSVSWPETLVDLTITNANRNTIRAFPKQLPKCLTRLDGCHLMISWTNAMTHPTLEKLDMLYRVDKSPQFPPLLQSLHVCVDNRTLIIRRDDWKMTIPDTVTSLTVYTNYFVAPLSNMFEHLPSKLTRLDAMGSVVEIDNGDLAALVNLRELRTLAMRVNMISDIDCFAAALPRNLQTLRLETRSQIVANQTFLELLPTNLRKFTLCHVVVKVADLLQCQWPSITKLGVETNDASSHNDDINALIGHFTQLRQVCLL